jgi:lipopolysaccharide transport system permease protein
MTIIDQSGISLWQKIAEYRQYRTLFVFLTLRDITLRYRQTLLGVLWAVLQPILPMVIFTLVFARVLGPETGSVPYSLFALSGLVPWMFFANAINTAGATFATNHNLLNKVYFPRAILPGAAVAAAVVDLIAGEVFLLGMLLWRGYRPTLEWLWLPVIALVYGRPGAGSWTRPGISHGTVSRREACFAVPRAALDVRDSGSVPSPAAVPEIPVGRQPQSDGWRG